MMKEQMKQLATDQQYQVLRGRTTNWKSAIRSFRRNRSG